MQGSAWHPLHLWTRISLELLLVLVLHKKLRGSPNTRLCYMTVHYIVLHHIHRCKVTLSYVNSWIAVICMYRYIQYIPTCTSTKYSTNYHIAAAFI